MTDSNPKKIIWLLQDGEPLPPQKTERLLRTGILSKYLSGADYEIIWFSSNFWHSKKKFYSLPSDFTENGVRYVLLESFAYGGNFSIRRVLAQIKVALSFYSTAKKMKRPDLIFCSYPSPELAFAANYFANKYKIKVITDFRDAWPDIFSDYLTGPRKILALPLILFYRALIRYIVQVSSCLVTIHKSLSIWLKRYSLNSKEIKIFNLSAPETMPRIIDIPEGGFTPQHKLRVIYSGSLTSSYMLSAIIEAANLLADLKEERVIIYIAGDGEAMQALKNATKSDNVVFTGFIQTPELEPLLSSCHIGLIPVGKPLNNYWLGNKFFEYLSHSLMLINHSSLEAAELIAHHEVGLNLSEFNANNIASALVSALSDSTILMRRMENSYRLYNDRFSEKQVYQDMSEYIKSKSRES